MKPPAKGNSNAKSTKNRNRKQVKLSYKQAKHPFHRLPFVSEDGTSFWDVPATGGYEGGWATGKALAKAFLRYMINHDDDDLGTIVLSMVKKLSKAQGKSKETIRGQLLGFISKIGAYAYHSACFDQEYLLDTLSEKEILKQANEGLAFDDVSYYKYLTQKTALEKLEKRFLPIINYDD